MLLNTDITGDSFLPVCLIQLSLARAGIKVSAPSCPVCDLVGQGSVQPVPSDVLRRQDVIEGKLQHAHETDVIVAQIIAKSVCHRACTLCQAVPSAMMLR